MTTKIGQSLFIANATTTVLFGRDITEAESSALKNAKKAVLAAGRQVGPDKVEEDGTWFTLWQESADAEAFVAVANGFTPPPTSASVEVLTD